jgi:catechol 2,3-dioxygenase-like lactoylglutathione lyase family enzyme
MAIEYRPEVTCAISVSNFEESLKFYQEVLGFRVVYRLEEMPWGELETPVPGCTVGLGQGESGWGAGGATLSWGVEDIDAARKELESKGVRFEGETMEVAGMVRLATFHDPDGNAMMLAQTIAQR